MKTRHILFGTICVALLLIGGTAGRMLQSDSESETLAARMRQLEARNEDLAGRLRDAREQIESWKAHAEAARNSASSRVESPPRGQEQEDGTDPTETDPRVRRTAALAGTDGAALLAALAELTALGEDHYPEVVQHWIRLINMDAAQLDALGLGRLQLASALVRHEGLMRFALAQSDLDPAFRQFTAQTLEQASVAVRRAILDELDFSTEKDKRVLHPLVRASRDFKDPIYVDRFLGLVQRTDLYNNSRQNIAMMIAEIEGPESRRALDALAAAGGHERMLPILENMHSPPATGLLVWNAGRPGSNRIGLNDIVLAYNQRSIKTMADLTRADASTRPGDRVMVKVLRNGVEQILYLTVTDTAPGHLHFNATPIKKRD